MHALQPRLRQAVSQTRSAGRFGVPRLSTASGATRTVCRAEGGDAEALPGALTLDDARGVLGVGTSASFDDILVAKNKKLSDADEDSRMKVSGLGFGFNLKSAQRMLRAIQATHQLQPRTSHHTAESPRSVLCQCDTAIVLPAFDSQVTHLLICNQCPPRLKRRMMCCSCTA